MNDKADAPEAAEAPQDISKINKYEQVVISSREARRLNEAVRSSSKELKRRVTDVAWERLMAGKVNFTYGEVPIVEEDFEFPELKQDGEEGLLAPDLLPSMPAPAKDVEDIEDADDVDDDEEDDDFDAAGDLEAVDIDDDEDVDDEVSADAAEKGLNP